MLGTNSQLCGICRNGCSCAWKYSAITWREEPMSLSLWRERVWLTHVLHPWLQISADPLFHHTAPHLLESFHSSILVANPEWLTPAIILFKHKHGRILLVTLCYKKVWICVCMNFCTICSLSCSTEWDFCLLCSLPNRYVWYWCRLRHGTDCTDFFH